MLSKSFLHERAYFKALIETVADSAKINDPALVENNYSPFRSRSTQRKWKGGLQ